MAEHWHDIVEREARIVRKMGDAAAFDYVSANYPPDEPSARGMALHLIKRRPWRKAFHRPLVELYLRDANHNSFDLVAQAFVTFMRADTLSRILWEETESRPDKRIFAALALFKAVRRRHEADHAALERWASILALIAHVDGARPLLLRGGSSNLISSPRLPASASP